MNRHLFFGLVVICGLAACKKKEAAAPVPVVREVAPVAAPVVEPGMEAENPAEKEGKP